MKSLLVAAICSVTALVAMPANADSANLGDRVMYCQPAIQGSGAVGQIIYYRLTPFGYLYVVRFTSFMTRELGASEIINLTRNPDADVSNCR